MKVNVSGRNIEIVIDSLAARGTKRSGTKRRGRTTSPETSKIAEQSPHRGQLASISVNFNIDHEEGCGEKQETGIWSRHLNQIMLHKVFENLQAFQTLPLDCGQK
eukprot:g7894.t1